MHAFSTCEHCVDGKTTNQRCTLDVAFKPSSKENNTNICVELSLAKGGKSGEERCFTILVSSVETSKKVGCQGLECYNDAFCDGHEPFRPECYCRAGFSGHNCSQGDKN
ncbi:hypothetical protein MAR_000392, partial [Mya arenaria]